MWRPAARRYRVRMREQPSPRRAERPSPPNRQRTLAVVACLAAAACATRPSSLVDGDACILIKSVRLPERAWLPWYSRFAEHVWIDFLHAGTWHRVEWNAVDHVLLDEIDAGRVFADERWGRGVAVHDALHGERAERVAARILTHASSYPCAGCYRPWPGPNSNSFVVWLAHEVDLPVAMPPAAVGKDFTTWVDVGVTPTGLGLEFETLPLGVELGLREGVELHLLGLTAGVGLWPPALKVPFLPAIPGGWFAPW